MESTFAGWHPTGARCSCASLSEKSPDASGAELVAPRLLLIVGPTGAGKTELALRVAERVGGEIVSADSQQVYRGMDIGTGKASADDRARVRHHLLDVVDPDEEMTAARFIELADPIIAELDRRGLPIIVAGGTMLYVRALLRGLFPGPKGHPVLRAELEARAEAEGNRSLWEELERVDAESAQRIHDTDRRRIIRALEVHRLSGVPMSEHHRRHRAQPPRYRAELVGLAPERPVLYERIDRRVEAMMECGFLEEVRGLRERGYGPGLRSQQAIGYAELHRYLDQALDLSEVVAEIQKNSRRYARRQLGWYRGDETIRWYPAIEAVDLEEIGRYLSGPAHE
jgi:tRNA dimethylallyltransferase